MGFFSKAIWILLAVATLGYADPAPFNGRQEFPNLFLRPAERVNPSAMAPDRLMHLESLLNQAAHSVFSRVTAAIVFPPGSQLQNVRIVPFLISDLRRNFDPDIQVEPSGGVVRAVLGYIYDRLYQEFQSNPQVDAEAVLSGIIHETRDIPHTDLGQGSDFDLLLSSRNPNYPKHRERLAARSKEILNSAAAEIFGNDGKFDQKEEVELRSLVLRGDVKDYHQQIERVSRNGGSSLDHLSFSMEGQGRFREPDPPRVKRSIIKSFLLGEVAYLPMSDQFRPADELPEERAVKTIRGFRALLEIPFLRVEAGDGEAVLLRELEQIELGLEKQQSPSEKALGEYQKLERNGRYGNAHNRFMRSQGSKLESKFMEVTARLQARSNQVLIHEMVPELPLGRPAKAVPERFLMGREEFMQTRTHDGILYHGTKEIGGALSILRSGMFMSRPESVLRTPNGAFSLGRQGASSEGPGGYTTGDKFVADVHSNDDIIINLKIAPGPIRFFTWGNSDEVLKGGRKDEWLTPIVDRARAEVGGDFFPLRARVFEILRDEHGVDVIVAKAAILQNLNSVVRPKRFIAAKLEQVKQQFLDSAQTQLRRLAVAAHGIKLFRLARHLGEDQAEFPIAQAHEYVKQMLETGGDEQRLFASVLMAQLDRSDVLVKSRINQMLVKIVEQGDSEFAFVANLSGVVMKNLPAEADLTAFIDHFVQKMRGLRLKKGANGDEESIARALEFLMHISIRQHHHAGLRSVPLPFEMHPELRAELESCILNPSSSPKLLEHALKLAGEIKLDNPRLSNWVFDLAAKRACSDDALKAYLSSTWHDVARPGYVMDTMWRILGDKRPTKALRSSLFWYVATAEPKNIALTQKIIRYFLTNQEVLSGPDILAHFGLISDRPDALKSPALKQWFIGYLRRHPQEANRLPTDLEFLGQSEVFLAVLQTSLKSLVGPSSDTAAKLLSTLPLRDYSRSQGHEFLSEYLSLLSDSSMRKNPIFKKGVGLHRQAYFLALRHPEHSASKFVQQILAIEGVLERSEIEDITELFTEGCKARGKLWRRIRGILRSVPNTR